MILQITAEHIAKARRVSQTGGHDNFNNPIAVALHDIDPHAIVTPNKVHRSCAHESPCELATCEPTILPYAARRWVEQYNTNPYSVAPTTLYI